MPAPTVSDLRTALAANLSSIVGVQQSAYMLANVTPPAIEVTLGEVQFDDAMSRGLDSWRFVVRAYVGNVSDVGAQKVLDKMIDPSGATSVKAALETDRTLGGKAEDLRVLSASGYQVYGRPNGPDLLGCEWQVDVIALGA